MTAAGTWRHAAGVIRANPRSFFASVGFYVGFFTLVLAPGLITRSIFDALSGRAPAGVNVWSLIALVVGLELGRFGLLYCGGVLFNVFRYRGEALFKRNLMAWIVGAPGPRVLPGSPGEAVSRFRDDVLESVGLSTILIVSPQVLTGARRLRDHAARQRHDHAGGGRADAGDGGADLPADPADPGLPQGGPRGDRGGHQLHRRDLRRGAVDQAGRRGGPRGRAASRR